MGNDMTENSVASRCYAAGPWKANIFSEKTMDVVFNHGQVVVHWSGFDSSSCTPEQNKANATLIAAAPDLLAALQKLVKWHDMDHNAMTGAEVQSAYDEAIDAAKLALRKSA